MAQGPKEIRSLATQQIPTNERLEYKVFWWGAPVGTATISTAPKGNPPKEPGLLQVTCEARLAWGLEAFYPVRVKLISLYDTVQQRPLRFEAYVVKKRGGVHESQITFDAAKGIALHQLPKNRTATVKIGPATQDSLSLIYYVRTLPLEVGQEIPLQVTADGKNWDLKGRIRQITQVKVGSLGRFHAVEGETWLNYPLSFLYRAKAFVYLSADDQRIPLLAKIHSRIGPVTVVLTRRDLTLDLLE